MTKAGLVYLHHEPSTSSAFSISTSSDSAESVDSSFLKRLFKRSKMRLSDEYQRSKIDPESIPSSTETMVMTPSPHTHPLLSKPYARDELSPNRHHPPALLLTDQPTIRGFSKSQPSTPRTVNPERGLLPVSTSVAADMYRRSLREREKAAMAAATDLRYVQEWGFFIKCYSEGRFNLSNPPDPPPRRPEFNHLTAPAPPDERQRLKAVKSCNISLPTGAHEKLHRLVLLARKVFQTRMACISLVDEHLEVIKAEHSFSKKYINRSDSIAAHVLLSGEPMVILDTVKDWRLRGNPLTQNSPNLRFYAGAPIVTFEGHTIGVFAVFDTQPRTTFPAKRNLMDFARLAMTEFEIVMEERDVLQQHMPTRIVGQTKVMDSDAESFISRRGKISAKLLKGIEESAEKMPPVSPFLAGEASELLLDSPTVPRMPQDTFVARPRERNREPLLDLDSPTVPRMSQDTFVARPRERNREPLLPSPETPTFYPEELEELEATRALIVTPPGTGPTAPPRTSSKSAPTFILTVPNDTPEVAPLATNLLLNPTDTKSPATPRYKLHRPLPIFPAPHLHVATATTTALPPSPATPRIPVSPGSITSMVEATYATSLIARSLDYDFVYLLRVSTTPTIHSPLIPIDPYRQKFSISTRVLVAHGLPNPAPIFDAGLHLRALRSVGGLIFQNPVGEDSDYDDVGYQLGILLPLIRDCGRGMDIEEDTTNVGEKCVGGIVLAAFARKASADPPFRAEEVRFLKEFGEAMRDILVKADRSLGVSL